MPRKNYIQIKASDQEKASWIAQAYLEGKNLSDYIRDTVNNSILNGDLIGQISKVMEERGIITGQVTQKVHKEWEELK